MPTQEKQETVPQWAIDAASEIYGPDAIIDFGQSATRIKLQVAAIIASHAPLLPILDDDGIETLKRLEAENARLKNIVIGMLSAFTGPSEAEPDRMQCDFDKDEYDSLRREFGLID